MGGRGIPGGGFLGGPVSVHRVVDRVPIICSFSRTTYSLSIPSLKRSSMHPRQPGLHAKRKTPCLEPQGRCGRCRRSNLGAFAIARPTLPCRRGLHPWTAVVSHAGDAPMGSVVRLLWQRAGHHGHPLSRVLVLVESSRPWSRRDAPVADAGSSCQCPAIGAMAGGCTGPHRDGWARPCLRFLSRGVDQP